MAVVESGPTQVQGVLAKGPIPDPFPTLDDARNDANRQAHIQAIRKLINEKGIKYIFFQQVSVSGHVNGKGVAATQWERVELGFMHRSYRGYISLRWVDVYGTKDPLAMSEDDLAAVVKEGVAIGLETNVGTVWAQHEGRNFIPTASP